MKDKFKIGQTVTVDYSKHHWNYNSHIRMLSEQKRIIVDIYKNGTLLLATSTDIPYNINCVISRDDFQSVNLLDEPIKEIKKTYKIVVEKCFGQ